MVLATNSAASSSVGAMPALSCGPMSLPGGTECTVCTDAAGLTERALKQAARELLLMQSSDWAFIMKTGTMVPYAVKRTKDHIMRFTKLYEQVQSGQIDEPFLSNCEWRDNIFPNINWRYYI